MDYEKLDHAMRVAEDITQRIYANLKEEEINDEAIIMALTWVIVAIGVKSDLPSSIIRAVVHYSLDSAIEDLHPEMLSIH